MIGTRNTALFLETQFRFGCKKGEKTAISINVYPTEESRANADKIRDENTATKGFRDTLHDIVPISGTVMVTYLDGKLVEE